MASASPLRRYANWLHLQWPAGLVEKGPEADSHGQTKVKGVYVAGDLTGIPLLKFSADTGTKVVRHMMADPDFKPQGKGASGERQGWDLVIIGAGVAGMAAAMEARKKDLNYVVLESSKPFSTLINFPKGKPIYTYPTEMVPEGELQFKADVREGLLEEVQAQSEGIDVKEARASHVERGGSGLEVVLEGGERLKAQRVLIAIGKSGDFRSLGVPGEEQDHVSNRLHDPGEHKGQAVLVVGGGDSALEAAIAIAQAGAREVTLSYRRESLNRPKPDNIEEVKALAKQEGSPLRLALGSEVQSISGSEATLKFKDGKTETLPADAVYTLIGREAPLDFFRRSGVGIRGEWTRRSIIACALFIVFCFGLYNWKSGGFLADLNAQAGAFPYSLSQSVSDVERLPPADAKALGAEVGIRKPWAYLQPLPEGKINAKAEAERRLAAKDYTTEWDEEGHLKRQVAGGQLFTPVTEGADQALAKAEVAPPRQSLKGTLAISAAGPSFWYTLAYVALVCIFGYRRIRRHKTAYITVQTTALAMVQALPLFLLPEIILPLMGYHGLLPGGLADTFFPAVDYGHGREYWRAYGLILAWPLNVYNWQTDQPLWGWLAVGSIQTFVIIPAIVWRWGKGAYCGWICSCGALAETLGDTQRQKMPHGPGWNKLNFLGQAILAIAAVLMLLRIASWVFPSFAPLRSIVSIAKDGYGAEGWLLPFQVFNYKWMVDVLLAGILGYGLYFWMSGRTWCRFACPLAALMHIYARFSQFRILSDKKKCISCNVCTTVCHQGIDIMSFANKGQPMADPECVRCSACVDNCPTGVLVFGRVDGDGHPIAIDPLLASPVHAREGLPELSKLGGDVHP